MLDNFINIDESAIVNEASIKEKFIEAINAILDKIVEFCMYIRKKLREYREKRNSSEFNKKYGKSGISFEKHIEKSYYMPYIDSAMVYIKSIYVDSYDHIPFKVLNMIQNKKDIDSIKLEVFGSERSDTYSDNNDYIYIIREYLQRIFKSSCNNKEELNKNLSDALSEKAILKFYDTKKFEEEFNATRNINKTTLGKDLKKISEIRENIIDEFINYSNATMAKVNKLKKMVKKEYTDEEKQILLRTIIHYSRMIKDTNIYKAVKSISIMEDTIYYELSLYLNK